MLSNRSLVIYSAARTVSTSTLHCASHYDVLGVTPKATQSEIKSAYYKLSKVHHPDKSKDEESAKQFRAITEAYEVLGNINLKKMYDKGLLVGKENKSRMDYTPEPEPDDPTLRFYKSRSRRHIVPTMDGRTPIYNFDTWSREHYGDLIKKTKYERDHLKRKLKKREDNEASTRHEAMLYLVFAIASLFIFFVVHGTSDYDNNRIKQTNEKKPPNND